VSFYLGGSIFLVYAKCQKHRLGILHKDYNSTSPTVDLLVANGPIASCEPSMGSYGGQIGRGAFNRASHDSTIQACA